MLWLLSTGYILVNTVIIPMSPDHTVNNPIHFLCATPTNHHQRYTGHCVSVSRGLLFKDAESCQNVSSMTCPPSFPGVQLFKISSLWRLWRSRCGLQSGQNSFAMSKLDESTMVGQLRGKSPNNDHSQLKCQCLFHNCGSQDPQKVP